MCLISKSSAFEFIVVCVLTLGGAVNEYGYCKISFVMIALNCLKVSYIPSEVLHFMWFLLLFLEKVGTQHTTHARSCQAAVGSKRSSLSLLLSRLISSRSLSLS